MGGYAATEGIPAAKALTLVTGVQILVGGLMVLLGIWGDLGSLVLALFLLGTAFLMHPFWKETDPMGQQMEMIHFNKDLALARSALAFVWVLPNGVDFTITDGLFS